MTTAPARRSPPGVGAILAMATQEEKPAVECPTRPVRRPGKRISERARRESVQVRPVARQGGCLQAATVLGNLRCRKQVLPEPQGTLIRLMLAPSIMSARPLNRDRPATNTRGAGESPALSIMGESARRYDVRLTASGRAKQGEGKPHSLASGTAAQEQTRPCGCSASTTKPGQDRHSPTFSRLT